MAAVHRFGLVIPLLLAALVATTAVRGEEARPARTPSGHACLDQKERRHPARSFVSPRPFMPPKPACPVPWCRRGFATVRMVSSMC